jgi:hypothetical protein
MIHGRSAFGRPTNDWRLDAAPSEMEMLVQADKLAGGSDAAWNGALHAAAETQSIKGPVATTTFFSGDLNPDPESAAADLRRAGVGRPMCQCHADGFF